jgi:hypothetical protein
LFSILTTDVCYHPAMANPDTSAAPISHAQAERLRELERLFSQWTEEDAMLSDEEADRLEEALRQSRGLEFRPPTPD